MRFPRNEIQAPDVPPEHCTIAPPFQQPTTVVPSKSWSRTRARNGAPDELLTLSVYRQG